MQGGVNHQFGGLGAQYVGLPHNTNVGLSSLPLHGLCFEFFLNLFFQHESEFNSEYQQIVVDIPGHKYVIDNGISA